VSACSRTGFPERESRQDRKRAAHKYESIRQALYGTAGARLMRQPDRRATYEITRNKLRSPLA
jgi:hypothetical protein